MASEAEQHYVLFPLMSPGHMNPMIDIAKLLAQHGVIITIITTPNNANRFQQTVDRAVSLGLRISFLQVEFPPESTSLPKDCENFDLLPSLGLANDLFFATNSLQQPVQTLLEGLEPKPDCIISDVSLPYTSRIATKLQVPRIIFNGGNCFLTLCLRGIYESGVLQNEEYSETEYFPIPGLHHDIRITKQQHPMGFFKDIGQFSAQIVEAEKVTSGIIMNSYEELEPEYAKDYKNLRPDYKVWCIGPVSLTNKHNLDLIQRGSKGFSTNESNQCLKWLDEQQPGLVLYICFGSICNVITLQWIELALGLEASNKPFLWVTRGGEKTAELEKWMLEEAFEERTKGRGLIVRGWAPQLAILSHVSIGGFLTHCGWNSALEAISAGVPMITWPLFGDQLLNERLVVDVLGIGVKVGSEVTIRWGEEDEIGVTVRREGVRRAIERLLEKGEESEERKRRVKELSVKAKRAVEENGSSYLNVKQFIQDIKVLSKSIFT